MANIPHIITSLIPKEKSILLMNIIAEYIFTSSPFYFWNIAKKKDAKKKKPENRFSMLGAAKEDEGGWLKHGLIQNY